MVDRFLHAFFTSSYFIYASLKRVACLQIEELQASYDRSVNEKQELTNNIAKTKTQLQRAAKLTTGLADEQVRWGDSVKVHVSMIN